MRILVIKCLRLTFSKNKVKRKGFAFCPEVTTKISKLKYQIKEVSYHIMVDLIMRKKINSIDGFEAIYCLINIIL